ncbi:hypothetical protein M422DRAFT_54610 [Sphaerobolus stellatus SS14]|uniref:Unplaced genomic scaffold SPHSTscaffold_230, whole genome shotgun sequence n=1 Tax=Sphaerobolus stellatus (strain SS14) TaxID=990650 RepID=A0A0C9U2U8_SPHS4|nr:hypothetical protein M422DRAFT_54610 [Sphaerobolus stellatus SS14]
MIIGADVVQHALGQLAGGYLNPVCFSFGWVAYSFNTIGVAVGDNRLLPLSDSPSIVINGKTGFVRENRSWVLGRLVRDFEYWMPKEVDKEVNAVLEEVHKKDTEDARKSSDYNQEPVPKCLCAGLCISVFRTSESMRPGIPIYDWVFYSGIVVSIIQLGVSVIPFILYSDFSTFMITGAGLILAMIHGALPQWKAEKWHCRRQKKTAILTTRNGAQHAIAIIGSDKHAFDLEDLASADVTGFMSTRIGSTILTILWFGLLVTVAGMKQNPWFLMAVGGIGMIQNIIVASASRRPGAHGIHLEYERCVARPKVMKALMDLEELYPHMGASLLDTFFPGKLFPKEKEYWDKAEKIAEAKDKAEKDFNKLIDGKTLVSGAMPSPASQGNPILVYSGSPV